MKLQADGPDLAFMSESIGKFSNRALHLGLGVLPGFTIQCQKQFKAQNNPGTKNKG